MTSSGTILRLHINEKKILRQQDSMEFCHISQPIKRWYIFDTVTDVHGTKHLIKLKANY